MGAFITIFIIILAVCLPSIISNLLAKDDNSWAPNSHPDLNAQIIDISSEKVRYTRDDVRMKTTIKFSDGFCYTTNDTEKETIQRGLTWTRYSLSVDTDRVIHQAIAAHKEAILKLPANTTVINPSAGSERPGSWKCPKCGLYHDKDIAVCYKCRTTKKDAI